MAGELVAYGAKLQRLTDGSVMRTVLNEAGKAGKKAALEAAERDLGGDRSFSGMRRKAKLGAGYDPAGSTSVAIKFRPQGLWMLADKGRRSSGKISPRSKQAVLTPQGPRRSSSYGPSRGLGTFTDAEREARRTVPKAAERQFLREASRLLGG